MPPELLTGLALFSFVSSITPGPNNLMLLASGANYGLRRTLPHMLGVALGFTAMVVLVGVGLLGLFDAYPVTYDLLRIASLLYLLFLAWKVATAARPEADGTAGEAGTPMTFVQAVLFQWVNPKAWTMALTALSIYAPSQSLAAVLLVAAVFGLINLPCITAWTLLGLQLQRLLTSQRRLVAFNLSMALLLVLSLYPVLLL